MSNSAMAEEDSACETEHFAVHITVNDVPIPIFSGGAEGTSYYVESNLTTPVSYKVQTEELVKDEKEIQSWPVTPYQILIRRFSQPQGPCYFDIKIDGVKVKSCTVEPDTVRKISGFKDKGQVREFLFSLPRLAKAVTDKLDDESRQSKVGMIEIECYEADYVTDSIHDRKKLTYQQASKNDVRAVTGGQYTMSTTKVGRVLYTKDATRRVHVWRKIRLLSKIVIRYRMGHTLREMGLQVPEYPKIPAALARGKLPRRPLIIRHNQRVARDRDRPSPDGSDNENEDPEPVTVKRENSPIMIDLTNDDSNSKTFDDDDSEVEFLGAKRIKTETVDLTEEGIIGDSAVNIEDSGSPKPSTSGLQGGRVENIGRNEENLSESEDDDDGNEMVVVYEKKNRRKHARGHDELNVDLTEPDENIVAEATNCKAVEVVTNTGSNAVLEADSNGGVTNEDVFDLLDLDFDQGESRSGGFVELFGESVLDNERSESPPSPKSNNVTKSSADDANMDADDVTGTGTEDEVSAPGENDDGGTEKIDDLPDSTADVEKTTDDVTSPSNDVAKPTHDVTAYHDDVTLSGDDVTTTAHTIESSNSVENPATGVTEPADDVTEPADDVTEPRVDVALARSVPESSLVPAADATPAAGVDRHTEDDVTVERHAGTEGDDVTMEDDDVRKANEDRELTNVESDGVDEDKLVVAEGVGEEEKKIAEPTEFQNRKSTPTLEIGENIIENDSGCSADASKEVEAVVMGTDAPAGDSAETGVVSTPGVAMETGVTFAEEDVVSGDTSNAVVESASSVAMETETTISKEVVAVSNADAVAVDIPNEVVESASSVFVEIGATVAKETVAISDESVAAGDISNDDDESASSVAMETGAAVATETVAISNEDVAAGDISNKVVESASSIAMESGGTVLKEAVAISNEDVAAGDVSAADALELLLDTSADDVAEKSEFSDATEDKLLE